MAANLLFSLFSWGHVHPVLVHFTTALLPASVASDMIGKYTQRYSLTSAAWWMLLYGAIATPLTVTAGWMWASEIGPEPGGTMTIHEWLGTGLVICFLVLAVWRGRIFFLNRKPGLKYLGFAGCTVAALMYQGYLGGRMTIG
jgi:Predicted membrane protein